MDLPYKDIRCPHIGQITKCKPFVSVVKVEDVTYRLVLIGKLGLRGYAEEPVYVIEQQHADDALGNPVWVDCTKNMSAETVGKLVGALVVALASAS